MANDEEVIVEVDVGTVDNVVPIVDLLPKIAEGLAEQMRRAQADPDVPPAAEARFQAAARHARLLAEEMQQARTIVPRFALFARPGDDGPGRPARPDRPGGRPNRPGGPGGPRRPRGRPGP